MMHNLIVAMRKEFDSLAYFTNIKERNKVINRMKYHRKKNEKTNIKEEDIECYEAFYI